MHQDLQDFKQLYLQYGTFVRGVLFRMVGPSLVEDAVQECFLKAWKGRNGFKGQSSVKTWLHRIATNVAIDGYRKKIPVTEFQETDLVVVEHQYEGLGEAINQAVLQLPVDFRVVVVAVIFEEMSLQEVQDSLQIPLGTVKSRLSRGRDLLQDLLTKMGY